MISCSTSSNNCLICKQSPSTIYFPTAVRKQNEISRIVNCILRQYNLVGQDIAHYQPSVCSGLMWSTNWQRFFFSSMFWRNIYEWEIKFPSRLNIWRLNEFRNSKLLKETDKRVYTTTNCNLTFSPLGFSKAWNLMYPYKNWLETDIWRKFQSQFY